MRKINNFYPTLGESWMLMGILLVCTLIGGFPAALLKLFVPSLSSLGFLLSYVLSFVLLIGFIILYRANAYSASEDTATVEKRPDNALFLLLLVMTPCLSVLTEPLSSWIPYPSWFDFEALMKNIIKTDVPSFLSVAVFAPVCEEWLFRGTILKGLLKHGKPWNAILWSAFMFGLIHFNPWQGIPAIGLGIFFGWVYWRTGSLLLCIFMHFVNNGMAFLLLHLYPDADTMADLLGNGYPYALVIAASVVLISGFFLYKKTGTNATIP